MSFWDSVHMSSIHLRVYHFRLKGNTCTLSDLKKAVLKFASATGATTFAGCVTPGIFTSQIQTLFREPHLLIVTNPRADYQLLTEALYVNIPTITLCNTTCPIRYVDIVIPCNNKGHHSVRLMWWILAREVMRMSGTIYEYTWDVMLDLYF
ncbi:hypothetical protein MATL_G00209440 [Megalops atlanticus]|uniref:40S ribosomal protein SA n=1 Tax=Megalops atlanticus TaxID=7932 RepID=A0A9D3SWR3_MEGAT|nr:hypothetical protein MATL_G00209440 [Megalops atlanticus]